jgi:hypothetical protein
VSFTASSPACKTCRCLAHQADRYINSCTQVRHRDRVSREVIIEERRYDKAGQEHTPSAASISTRGEPFDTSSLDNLDSVDDVPVPPPSLSASSLSGSFGSSYSDEANSDNPYAWAQRLREIPDKVLLSVLPAMCIPLHAHSTYQPFESLSMCKIGSTK